MFPTMDEQVAKNLKLTYRLFKVVGHTPEGRPLEEDLGSVGNGWASNLEDGGRYRLSIAVQNTGIELFFRQTQIRVAPSLRNDIPTSEIYVDSHFETQTNRGDSPCDSGLLGPESSYPGGGLSVYFKRTIPLDENHGVVRCFDIGVYAEVVPQGNCWHVLRL